MADPAPLSFKTRGGGGGAGGGRIQGPGPAAPPGAPVRVCCSGKQPHIMHALRMWHPKAYTCPAAPGSWISGHHRANSMEKGNRAGANDWHTVCTIQHAGKSWTQGSHNISIEHSQRLHLGCTPLPNKMPTISRECDIQHRILTEICCRGDSSI